MYRNAQSYVRVNGTFSDFLVQVGFFFLLFGEKVDVAIPFSASFSGVGCIKDGVVSDINSIEKSNMC